MLILLLAAICVIPGSVAEAQIDLPFAPIYQATLYSGNPSIAAVTGTVKPRSRQATFTVEALRRGEAKLWMRYVSGISIYNVVVGEMIVDDALGVTVSPANPVVAIGTPLTLSATTTGPDAAVAWYEGDRYLGIGHAISLTLPEGAHRVRAEAWNRCGTVSSEAEIAVTKARQRAVRH